MRTIGAPPLSSRLSTEERRVLQLTTEKRRGPLLIIEERRGLLLRLEEKRSLLLSTNERRPNQQIREDDDDWGFRADRQRRSHGAK